MNRAISILMLTVYMCVIAANSQQEVHPGVKLYQEGKNAEAVRSLAQAVKQNEFKSNGEVWNYLGLAYTKGNDYKNARKALEKAVKLLPTNSIYHSNLAYVYLLTRQNGKARSTAKKAIEIDSKNVIAYYLRGVASFRDQKLNDAEKDADQMIMLDAANPQGYILRSNISLAKLERVVSKGSSVRANITFLKEAAETLRAGVEKCKDSPNLKLVEDEFESIKVFSDYFSKDSPVSNDPNAAPEPGVTPLKILSKPRASYTDSARQGNVQGTIRAAVLFAADGRVQHVLLLHRLGSGLDEQAVSAARRIKFEPTMKDGKPISVVRMVEYTFSIY